MLGGAGGALLVAPAGAGGVSLDTPAAHATHAAGPTLRMFGLVLRPTLDNGVVTAEVVVALSLLVTLLVMRRLPRQAHAGAAAEAASTARPARAPQARSSGSGPGNAKPSASKPSAAKASAAKPSGAESGGVGERARRPADHGAGRPRQRVHGGVVKPASSRPALAAGRGPKPGSRGRAKAATAQRQSGEAVKVKVHEVATPEDLVVVRLAARADRISWDCAPPHERPPGSAFVCLGTSEKGCLLVDLASAPGTVAVRGRPASAARLARSIVRQLALSTMADRATVTLVGDVGAEVDPPPGVDYANDLDQVAEAPPAGPPGRVELVVFRAGHAEDLGRITRLLTDPDRTVVPLALGDAPDALWSFTATQQRPVAVASQ